MITAADALVLRHAREMVEQSSTLPPGALTAEQKSQIDDIASVLSQITVGSTAEELDAFRVALEVIRDASN